MLNNDMSSSPLDESLSVQSITRTWVGGDTRHVFGKDMVGEKLGNTRHTSSFKVALSSFIIHHFGRKE